MKRKPLIRKPCSLCGLVFRHRRDCSRARAPKPLARGSGPKQRNPRLDRARRAFKKAVFERYGDACVFCGLPGAIDPAHIIPTNLLGALRHADVRLARPAHRECHREQHDGKRRFPADVIADAYAAHNALDPVVPLYPKDAAA